MNWGRAKEKSGHGVMNYKRKKPAYRRIRRTNGYIGLGRDQIKQVIDKDYKVRIQETIQEQA